MFATKEEAMGELIRLLSERVESAGMYFGVIRKGDTTATVNIGLTQYEITLKEFRRDLAVYTLSPLEES